MTITDTGDRLEVLQSPSTSVGTDAGDPPSAPPQGDGAGAEVPASARPTFTITDAATACSVSRKTITRKLPELAGHGAAKDDDGVWRIPVEALLAVGLHPGRSLPEGPTAARSVVATAPPARPAEPDTVTIPRDRWDDVRIRLARAEAEAAERGLALADARLALRALTSGPAAPARVVPAFSGSTAAPTGAPGADPSAVTHGPRNTSGPGADQVSGLVEADPTSGRASSARSAPAGEPLPAASTAAPTSTGEVPVDDIAAARNLAARTGGYVPAGAMPAKRRRWWQSR